MFSKLYKYSFLAFLELTIIVLLGVVVWSRLTQLRQSVVILPASPVIVATPTSTILFVGDMMFDRYVRRFITEAQDPLLPFARTASTIQEADLAIGNLEGPISDRGTKQGSEYSFRFEPVGTINALKYAGFDVVNLANNHIWDYGRQAALDTMTYLREAGIEYIGFGRDADEANTPIIKRVGNARVALLGYTEFYSPALWADDRLGLSEFKAEKIVQRISQIKSSDQADIVVVSVHWGDEYEAKANEMQRRLAHQFIDAGADLVVGHHPHVVQEVERYEVPILPLQKGVPPVGGEGFVSNHVGYIAYSLGNFVFDQNFSPDTKQGLMIEAVVDGKKVIELKQLPIRFTKSYQPYITN
jgi:poly-gamma-glutamate synthesis protein (capsule biosynthesis protein)